MLDTDHYDKMELEELLKEEKKIKRKETTSAVLIGFLIGVIVYGVVKNGIGFIYIFIPLILIYGIYRNSQKLKDDLKQIQTEIKTKNKT